MAGRQVLGTVVFDLDGTLVDTSRDMLGAANEWFRRLGAAPPLDLGADARTAFAGGRAMLRLGMQRLGMLDAATGLPDEARIARGYGEFLEIYLRRLDAESRIYDGAVEAVQALRRAGYATGICTNKPADLSERLLKSLDMWELFDSHVGAGTLPVRKPDPAPLLAAVTRAGGSAHRAMLLGDTLTDLQAGRAAGIPVALVAFGPDGPGIADLGPDAILESYAGLPEIAGRLLGLD